MAIENSFEDHLDADLQNVTTGLREAGKSFSSAFLLYLSLLILAAVITHGKTISSANEIRIPGLGIELDRIPAALFIIVLLGLAMGRLVAISYVHQLFGIQLKYLRRKRYGEDYPRWHCYHPSVFTFAKFASPFGKFGQLGIGTLSLTLIAGFLTPVWFLWSLYNQAPNSLSVWVFGWGWGTILLVMIAIIGSLPKVPKSDEDEEAILAKVAQHENSLLHRSGFY